ncbi:MFS transporter [Marinobacter salinexigens]|uniref:MFS transporter n=1 Tax=Marinobacter salinexigens TaxID=2919747 RepID=A0A5B0VHJ9_9GAMM|nr:VC0807 family protein [Marinobacter salinexigens]KAA1174157.1 MFS transporter [Marinobacter salinexigens]
MTSPSNSATPDHKPRPWVDLLVSIVIPSVILMKLSGDEYLGNVNALLLGLAFPLGWGLFELIRYNKKNFIAVLGLVSVGLTGGIGLMELDPQWLAIKEAAVPAVIGLAVLISTRTKYPLVRTLLYNPSVLDVDKIHRSLEEKGSVDEFELRLLKASYYFSGTFLFSSIMNYVIARWIVTSPAGTQAFNEELGRMTLVSYPMIAIPSMIMMMLIFYYLWRTIRRLTGYTLEEVMAPHLQEKDEKKKASNESATGK